VNGLDLSRDEDDFAHAVAFARTGEPSNPGSCGRPGETAWLSFQAEAERSSDEIGTTRQDRGLH
jgi:hypothetical protein